LSIQDEQLTPEPAEHNEEEPKASSAQEKKPFVEPQISAAINVFDATSFFLNTSQVAEEL
jgi:hypothetical protein